MQTSKKNTCICLQRSKTGQPFKLELYVECVTAQLFSPALGK